MHTYNEQKLKYYIDTVVDYDKIIYYDSNDDGGPGKSIENSCFGVNPNSRNEADLQDIGFEIKGHNYYSSNNINIGTIRLNNADSVYYRFPEMVNKNNNFRRNFGFCSKNEFIIKDGNIYLGDSSTFFSIDYLCDYMHRKVCNGVIYVRYEDIEKGKMLIKDIKVLKDFNIETFKKLLFEGHIHLNVNIVGDEQRTFKKVEKASLKISQNNFFELFDQKSEFLKNNNFDTLKERFGGTMKKINEKQSRINTSNFFTCAEKYAMNQCNKETYIEAATKVLKVYGSNIFIGSYRFNKGSVEVDGVRKFKLISKSNGKIIYVPYEEEIINFINDHSTNNKSNYVEESKGIYIEKVNIYGTEKNISDVMNNKGFNLVDGMKFTLSFVDNKYTLILVD